MYFLFIIYWLLSRIKILKYLLYIFCKLIGLLYVIFFMLCVRSILCIELVMINGKRYFVLWMVFKENFE